MHIMFLVVLGNRKALCFVSCQLLLNFFICLYFVAFSRSLGFPLASVTLSGSTELKV